MLEKTYTYTVNDIRICFQNFKQTKEICDSEMFLPVFEIRRFLKIQEAFLEL